MVPPPGEPVKIRTPLAGATLGGANVSSLLCSDDGKPLTDAIRPTDGRGKTPGNLYGAIQSSSDRTRGAVRPFNCQALCMP